MSATGIISIKSQDDFDTTYQRLRGIIENNPNLKISFELDHQANAKKVDFQLRPTKIILFGNPKLGSPLMNAAATSAIDLPQKMLVHQDDDGQVFVSYNDPMYLHKRHGITGQDELLKTVTRALENISEGACNK